jgi:hypothetical protein
VRERIAHPVLADVDRWHERAMRGDAAEGAVTAGPPQPVDLDAYRRWHQQRDPEPQTRHPSGG